MIDLRRAGLILRCCPAILKHACCSVQQLLLPGVDLVRVNPVGARQFGYRPLALDRRQRHLRLECRPVLLACLLHVPLPRQPALLGAGLHLNQLSHFRGPCVDGPSAAREKVVMPLRGRVQPCVRPVDAARMAAGPDEVRGSDPKSAQRARSAWTPWVCPIPGSTGLSSPLTTPAFPLDRIRPSGTSATWPEPRDCGRVAPRRSARSCSQAPPIPAWL